jgi:hypothetical protein
MHACFTLPIYTRPLSFLLVDGSKNLILKTLTRFLSLLLIDFVSLLSFFGSKLIFTGFLDAHFNVVLLKKRVFIKNIRIFGFVN